MRKGIKTMVVRGCLVAISSILALAAVELGLRLMIPRSTADLFAFDAHSKRSRVMKSGYEGICFGVPIALNQNGFRDASPKASFPAKEQGEFRVIVLGDSFTACAGVSWEDLFTTRLQASLHKERRPSQGGKVSVFNLGVAGYNVVHYWHTLAEVGLGLEPDLIVVANYVPNDFEMEDYRRYEAIAQGRLKVSPDKQRQPLYLDQAFGPQLWRLRSALAGLWKRPSSPAPDGPEDKPTFGPGSDGWDENVQAMREIVRLANARGIPLLVPLLPHPSNFRGQASHHNTVLQTWKDLGINSCDLLPTFIAAGISPRAYRLNLIDSHPNARYNSLVANELTRTIREDPTLNARLFARP